MPVIREGTLESLNESFERCCSVLKSDLHKALVLSVKDNQTTSVLADSQLRELLSLRDQASRQGSTIIKQATCI